MTQALEGLLVSRRINLRTARIATIHVEPGIDPIDGILSPVDKLGTIKINDG